jgi:hypothetical protein
LTAAYLITTLQLLTLYAVTSGDNRDLRMDSGRVVIQAPSPASDSRERSQIRTRCFQNTDLEPGGTGVRSDADRNRLQSKSLATPSLHLLGTTAAADCVPLQSKRFHDSLHLQNNQGQLLQVRQPELTSL